MTKKKIYSNLPQLFFDEKTHYLKNNDANIISDIYSIVNDYLSVNVGSVIGLSDYGMPLISGGDLSSEEMKDDIDRIFSRKLQRSMNKYLVYLTEKYGNISIEITKEKKKMGKKTQGIFFFKIKFGKMSSSYLNLRLNSVTMSNKLQVITDA